MTTPGFDPETVLRWHAGLREDRAGRAALRRAQTIDDLLLSGPGALAFTRLRRQLPNGGASGLARAALAVAEVDKDAGGDERGAFGRRCGTGEAVSQARFRLLMSAEVPDDFLRLLRSALGQLDRRAPLADVFWLARSWHRAERRQLFRRDQLLAYYEALPNKSLAER